MMMMVMVVSYPLLAAIVVLTLLFLSTYSMLTEFSLIEDEKFDFLIPDEYFDESIDGTSGSDQHKDSRMGGIMACSSPIIQNGCPEQSVYDKALLQLKYRGRADLVLNHYWQKQPREQKDEEGEAGSTHSSPSVADSLHGEVAALDIVSSFGEEDNSDCRDSREGSSSPSLLIDLEVSPSAPPPSLNNTVTLDFDSVGLEGEGQGKQHRNTTFTLIDRPFEGSTSAAVEETANSGSECPLEEEGHKPSRLPTLANRTQTSLVNVVSARHLQQCHCTQCYIVHTGSMILASISCFLL